jgi:uncharacterized protein
MPVQPTYPGVYVQEVPSGVRTIMGVSTSTAVFIGRAIKGTINEPELCTSLTDFEREFSLDGSVSEMANQISLFFVNGGTKCYAMRITDGTEIGSSVKIKNESTAPTDVLQITAKQRGASGNLIRVAIAYGGPDPEIDFDMEVIRFEIKNGQLTVAQSELFRRLSMDKKSSNFVEKIINKNSALIDATALITDTTTDGFSLAGRPIIFTTDDPASLRDAMKALFGKNVSTNEFNISVDNFVPVNIALKDIDLADAVKFPLTSVNDFLGKLRTEIKSIIDTAILNQGGSSITVDVQFIDGPDPGATTKSKLLKINSQHKGDVRIYPSSVNDLATVLMMGTPQGGLEIGAFSANRPAPTGICFKVTQDNFINLAAIAQNALKTFTLTDTFTFDDTAETRKVFKNHGTPPSSSNDGNDGVREKLLLLRDSINDYASKHPSSFCWKSELNGYRLSIVPTKGEANKLDASLATGTTNINTYFTKNVRYYSLGNTGLGDFQELGVNGVDGGSPKTVKNYEDAFNIIDKKVDIFNLMILPKDFASDAVKLEQVYGTASTFCQKRRALLLMDAPEWNKIQDAADGIANLRIGLVKDYSAIYYPKIKVSSNGGETIVGPTGAVAGIMSRIDSSRGIWKAPAGVEADIRGISGIVIKLTDMENGQLNPHAINTIRSFPNGIVIWGARTMDGDDDFQSEYKYIPVRRLALYMEESLYRGLKWVVFEPNDEPLWSQIRLNVGAFMHDLFTQGAFQGQSPKDAYFVKCDKETTTQNDINKGVVNIWVGFAPLKPAEFVILHIQQMAGQINQ